MSNGNLRVATVFSGIGSPEFALHRANIPHSLIFACDNGEINCTESEEVMLLEMQNMSFAEKTAYVASKLIIVLNKLRS